MMSVLEVVTLCRAIDNLDAGLFSEYAGSGGTLIDFLPSLHRLHYGRMSHVL